MMCSSAVVNVYPLLKAKLNGISYNDVPPMLVLLLLFCAWFCFDVINIYLHCYGLLSLCLCCPNVGPIDDLSNCCICLFLLPIDASARVLCLLMPHQIWHFYFCTFTHCPWIVVCCCTFVVPIVIFDCCICACWCYDCSSIGGVSLFLRIKTPRSIVFTGGNQGNSSMIFFSTKWKVKNV